MFRRFLIFCFHFHSSDLFFVTFTSITENDWYELQIKPLKLSFPNSIARTVNIKKFVFFFSYFSHRLDVQYKTIDYLYTPTYTRIGAYFIGVYVGWYLSHYERKLDIQKVCIK